MATGSSGKKSTKKPPARKRATTTARAAAGGQEPQSATEAVTGSIQEMMAATQQQIQKDLRVFGRELKRVQTHVKATVEGMQEAHANALMEAMEQTRAAAEVPAGEVGEPEAAEPGWELGAPLSSTAGSEAVVAGAVWAEPGTVMSAPQAESPEPLPELEAAAEAACHEAIEATAQAVESTRLAALGSEGHTLAEAPVEASTDEGAAPEVSEAEPVEGSALPDYPLNEESVSYTDQVVQQAVHPTEQAVNAAGKDVTQGDSSF